jgi:hypothetical protein
MWYKHALIEFLVAEKESVLNIHTHLCNVYRSAVVNRSTTGQQVKRSNASGTRQAELHDLPQAILPQLLVLKCLSMLRPLFARINASQCKTGAQSYNQQRKSHII